MPFKDAARRQNASIVDQAASAASGLDFPREGWMRTVRKALGMSGAQLARRMGVTRARVAQAEASEIDGGITLKSMEAAAEAMGCRFVYAIVPETNVAALIEEQAIKKAVALVGRASTHMALESQAVSEAQSAGNIARLARHLAAEMPADLWNEK